jgi:probable rRNA maturation factor
LVILQKKVAGLSGDALDRFVLRARRAAGLQGTVIVLVTSSAAVRSLNRNFRNKNKPTDVLSFPSALPTTGPRRSAQLAGEIAISADIAVQNAVRLGHSAAQEIKVLVLHGILHLAGFDHERDNGEMARKEMKLRRALKLPAALIERTRRTP